MLVKLNKRRAVVTADPSALKPDVAAALANVQVGDDKSVLDFVRKFGSHYIRQVAVGESLYQLFALTAEQYAPLKAEAGRSGRLDAAAFSALQSQYLAPWNVRAIGRPLASSGDSNTLSFLDTMLKDRGQFGEYDNLFKVSSEPGLFRELDELTSSTEAVVGLGFASLVGWVPDLHAREFYAGVVNTNAILWETNI